MFRSTLRLDGWIAWLYIFVLAIGSIAAILGLLDWIKSKASIAGEGPHAPVWQRVFLLAFVLFALYISVPLLIGIARGGRIWPGELTPMKLKP